MRLRLALCSALAAASLVCASAPHVTATPIISTAIPSITEESPQWRKDVDKHAAAYELTTYSPAMNREVPVAVIPGPPGAPTLYLLNGADGGEDRAHWIENTDVLDFYADKGINVVIPMAGAFSYYTDWADGSQAWETFLTKELPGPLEAHLGAGDRRAIMGVSMSATSALTLAQHNPGFYQAAASLSGCAQTSSPLGMAAVATTLRNGAKDPVAMWGPYGSAAWRYNDAHLGAPALRGTALYISNGSGLQGAIDQVGGPYLRGKTHAQASASHINTSVVGGPIEMVTNRCTHDLKARLDAEGIPATYVFRSTGTHSWGYWQEDLRDSWPVLAQALGVKT